MRLKGGEAFVIIDGTEHNRELLEKTGFLNPDVGVYVETARERILFANIRDIEQAKASATVDRVLPEEEYKERGEQSFPLDTPDRRCVSALHGLLEELGIRNIVVQAERFPLAAARALEDAGYHIHVRGCRWLSQEAPHWLMIENDSSEADVLVGLPQENADLRYATGVLTASAPVVFVRNSDACVAVVAQTDAPLFAGRKFAGSVTTYKDLTSRKVVFPLSLPARRPLEALHAVLGERGIGRIMVQPDFPYAHARVLERIGYVVSWRSPYFSKRARKSSEEITAIQSVMRCAEGAMTEAERLIGSSRIEAQGYLWVGEGKQSRILTSEMVREVIISHLRRRGCECPHGVIVSCGAHAAQPHHAGTGALRARKPIIIDIFSRSTVTGYWADMTRTFCRGRAPERLRRMYEAVREAQKQAMATMRSGVSAREPDAVARRVFDERGFPRESRNGLPCGFIHGFGHGVGLELHEEPYLRPGSVEVLETGNVVTPEPGLYYPGFGGVRVEDTVVIAVDGCRNLTRFQQDGLEL